MIPRRLLFIWLGYHLPKYALFAINAFKKMNPSFDVKLVCRSVDQLEKLYNTKSCLADEVDDLIRQCLRLIVDKSIQTPYRLYIEHQRRIYSKHVHVVNLLSDILRIALLNKYGGIYLDCDCFPVKPFDDKLLSLEYFTVDRHYNAHFQHGLDNYFIGACKQDNETLLDGIFDKKCVHLLQTTPNWHNNINFIYNKQLFFKQQLKLGSWSLSKDFYIEHYNRNSWHSNSTSMLPTSFIDDLLMKSK